MKLLELLVKERIGSGWVKPWSEIKQNGLGEMFITKNAVTVKLEGHEGLPIADDWQTAIVTKEQYDNACKLVDDGYTLWFGGECPVNTREKVRVVLDGETMDGHDDFNRASDWRWEWEDGLTNIIAYKVVKPVLISTHKHDASLEQFYAQGWTDEQLIEHGYAKVAEPGEREPFRPGLSCEVVPGKPVDVVNHPSHYTNGKVECIDAIESATVGKTGIEAVCVANVIKYLWRYEDKNGLEDIKKAQWYLNKLIEVKK